MSTSSTGLEPGPVLADSVTDLTKSAGGRVVVCGSHGGRFSGWTALEAGVAAVVFNDAGIGLDRAGIAGLDLLASAGTPALSADHLSCRIGDAADVLERGRVSFVNQPASSAGCRTDLPVRAAVDKLLARARTTSCVLADNQSAAYQVMEARRLIMRLPELDVWALDSASMIVPSDSGSIVLTGSHGGLVGGRRDRALKAATFAAVFNDAGGGADGSGYGRLPVLASRLIPAATVATASARIGEGWSTYVDGVVSAVNQPAESLGARVNMTARSFVECVLEHYRSKPGRK